MSPIVTSSIAFAVIFGGSFVGMLLRNALPEHHLADDAKDVVRLGAGLIATIAGLVLGLLIASANSSFDTQTSQVRGMTANIVVLDNLLSQYGPEARTARDGLRRAIDPLVERIWAENSSGSAKEGPFKATAVSDVAYAEILKLLPQNDSQRSLKDRALQVSTDLAQTRLLLFGRVDSSIPRPFLAVLVFWLAIIFASYSLFSRINPTLIVALFVFALSASAAIFLILELSQPFTGLMQISSTPLRNALTVLGP